MTQVNKIIKQKAANFPFSENFTTDHPETPMERIPGPTANRNYIFGPVLESLLLLVVSSNFSKDFNFGINDAGVFFF